MNSQPSENILRLIAQACDGHLSADEHVQLQQLLLEDEVARAEYSNFCQMEADLHFSARANRAGRKALAIVSTAELPSHPWSMGTIFLAGAVTASLAAALILWLGNANWRGAAEAPRQAGIQDIAANETPSAAVYIDNDKLVPEGFVAHILRVSPDFTWKHPTASPDFLLRIKPGDKLNLAKGLVQMEFASGARIILHGPAVFTPTSATTGHLESGRLTGEVTEGNFHLTTPAAEVIDLGTEFGVQVDSEKSTDVVVFNGKVQVVGTSGTRESLDMTKGMAARIRSDGSKHLVGVATEADQFARSIPADSVGGDKNVLSVVDVFCGGDGFNTSLSGAADPLTGEKDHGNRVPGNRRTNGKYHLVDWNSILDGVFMPTAEGVGTQINSQGLKIDLPKNNGLTWGPMWARRWESALQTAGETTDFWGRKTDKNIRIRLEQSKFGMIGMHANVGFTLDLRDIRLLQGREVAEFRAVVTNLDNSAEEYVEDAKRLKRTADLRVFVDGELRFERLGFRREDGDAEMTVKLTPEDRFLTIVSSDAGDSSYDHVVLIDPVVTLHSARDQGQSTLAATPETRDRSVKHSRL